MKTFLVNFSILMLLTSCAFLQKTERLNEVKANLDCIEYRDKIAWKQISENFGSPDIAPIPESGTDLSKNTRIYNDKIIIFYTERQEVEENGKVRFKEIVSKIEICKEK